MTEVWLGFTFFIKWQTYDKVCQGVASQTKNVYSFTPKKKKIIYLQVHLFVANKMIVQ